MGILGFSDLLAILAAASPLLKLLLALVVFVLFWALKKPLTNLVSKVLFRLLNLKKQWISKEKLNHALVPCHSVFALLGAYIALDIMGWADNALVLHAVRIAVIGLVAWILVRFWDVCADLLLDANDFMGKQLNLNLSKTLMSFVRMAVKVVLIVFAALAIVAETGTDVTALITGLGLDFDLTDEYQHIKWAILHHAGRDYAASRGESNLFAGVVILLDHPFDVDDYIETPDVVGTVEEITFRSTRLRTLTNTQVIVPNNVLTSKPITNWSRLQKRRVAFTIGLEYGTTSDKMQRCVERITEMLNNSEEVVPESACVNFDAFADSSLNISIVYYTKEVALAPHLKIKEALNLNVMAIVEEEGCSFAYPTQTLHIQKD